METRQSAAGDRGKVAVIVVDGARKLNTFGGEK